MNNSLKLLSNELSSELSDILQFWIERTIDHENGGFYGRIDGNNQLIANSNKGSILNARILWTFSSAYRILGKTKYLKIADRAKAYLINFFWDKESGGVFWMLNYEGKPQETKKQIYALAFSIYALTEFYMISEDAEVLDHAISLFQLIEEHSFDKYNNGYFEAFSKDWILLEDLRLSEKDANEKKTMNTHLHILEAYTNLYRVWPDSYLKRQLTNLIHIFTDKIIDNESYRFKLFFDENWNSKSAVSSFGHNIEGSWLLCEAAEVLNDNALLDKAKIISLKMAENVLNHGIDMDGALVYEAENGRITDTDKHWWPQAEAIVGFINAWQLSKDVHFLEKAFKIWEFTKSKIIDKQNGEWYFRVNRDGIPYSAEDKVGPWKCPYHNSRMCLEIIKRAAL